MTECSPVDGVWPSPIWVKKIGGESGFRSQCHKQKEMICPFLSFVVATTCHLKRPSNKLKEPCQAADSIIN